MPQSLAKLYVHLVFSTKNREPLLHDNIRSRMWQYLGGILRDIESPSIMVGGIADHVHLLFRMSRTVTIAAVVEEVKTASSRWIKTQEESMAAFHWQSGYGAFSVSESNLSKVSKYIAHQEEHHRKMTYQDEFRKLLQLHEIEFDERYVWD